ncbi:MULTISPECIES: DUF3301 domain-containing protein [Marinobacter]|uniref:DUF3301 domain-containing protein n=1 Tax=Marinobacter TaxID=2742 RepID=UPI000DAE7F93|nr:MULTISPECIES: DUF3301 domain-containing protein [Marinobacter]
MTLFDLTLLFLFGFLAWYWWRAKEIKDLVLDAARRYCKRMDVTLLDDAVYLRGLWFKRDPEGRIRVWRRFLFEFTATGEERYTGRAILLGKRIEHLQLDAHRMPPSDLH